MRMFEWLGGFIGRRYVWVLGAGLLLVALAVFGATRISMATGMDTWLSPKSQTYQDYERYQKAFGGDAVVVLVAADSTDRLLAPSNLRALDAIEGRVAADPKARSVTGPALLVKQAAAQQTGTPAIPQDPRAILPIVVDPQSGQVRPQMRSAFPDGTHALIAIVPVGGLSMAGREQLVSEAQSAVDASGLSGVRTIVTGGSSSIFKQVEESMTTSLRNMFIVSIVLMLLILALVFAVRGLFAWRWLPLGMVGISIVYTFGVMGFIGVPMTMVTMAIFPILIGLGVDYAIQIHNRYDEEASRGQAPAQALKAAVARIGPAIGIAIAAACLGFAALFFSPVPMIRDFGKMLLIGVVTAYLASVFLLLGVLYWRERRGAGVRGVTLKAERAGPIERALRLLARPVIGSPAVILPVALALTVAGLVADSRIATQTDWTSFISQELPAVQELRALERIAGETSAASVFVEAPDVTDPAALGWMAQLEQRLASSHSDAIAETRSAAGLVLQATGGRLPADSSTARAVLSNMPPSVRRNFVTDDYGAASVLVITRDLDTAQWKKLRSEITAEIASPPSGVKATLTGTPVLGMELLDALTGGRVRMTLIGVALVFSGLLLAFRFNLLRALIATLPIGLVLGWSSGFMFLLGIKYTPATATLGALILGIGTEFTILLMMRYYEERGNGMAPVEAMTIAMTKIGRAIIASGLTVIGGFAALLIARDFPILVDFGVVTMISVAFALLSTLLVLPPLIVWLDRTFIRARTPRPTAADEALARAVSEEERKVRV